MDWLMELDHGERGADGQHWTQYASTLDMNGYKCIIQITEDRKDSTKELADLCSMPLGIARLLIKYATSDTERITKKERKACKGAHC
jgi:hypothetical protein